MKKSNIKIRMNFIVSVVGAIIGLLALIGLSMDGATTSVNLGSFGTTTTSLGKLSELTFGTSSYEANTGLIIAFVLVLVGAIAGCASYFCKYLSLLGGVCFLAAAIIYFCTISLLNLPSISGVSYALGGGVIMAAIFLIVGCGAEVGSFFLVK